MRHLGTIICQAKWGLVETKLLETIKKHHSHVLPRRCRDTLKLSLIVLETGVKNKRPSAYCAD